jgi:hypothetical protein
MERRVTGSQKQTEGSIMSNYTFSPHNRGKNHHHLVIHSGLSINNNPDKDGGESAVTEVVGNKELTKISSSSAHSAKQYNTTHPAPRDPNEIVTLESQIVKLSDNDEVINTFINYCLETYR